LDFTLAFVQERGRFRSVRKQEKSDDAEDNSGAPLEYADSKSEANRETKDTPLYLDDEQ
jgi:hypothetical protein